MNRIIARLIIERDMHAHNMRIHRAAGDHAQANICQRVANACHLAILDLEVEF